MSRTLLRALPLLLCCAVAAACALAAAPVGVAMGTSGTTTAPTGTPTTTASSTAGAAGTTPPGGVTYGLGDGAGMFARCVDATAACCYGNPASCPASAITGYWNDPSFQALASSRSAHRLRYVRLFVSIDAVAQFNGSTTSPGCVPSQVLQHSWIDPANRMYPAGQSLQDLMAGLVEAHADGLTPLVSISGYPIRSSRASFESQAPDPTTPVGYWDYRCGIEGILGAVSRLPAADRPHAWEPFNEPDRVSIYQDHTDASAGAGGAVAGQAAATTSTGSAPGCAVTPSGIPDGPAKAACDYVLADQLIHGFAGHAGDTVLAGVFSRLSPAYLEQYAAQLAYALPAAEFPASWAVHDYSAVTRGFEGSSLGPLTRFDQELATDTDGRAKSLWITEAGTLLTSRSKLGGCPAVGADPAGTIGACINGNGQAQLADITSFFQLPQAGTSVPITHLFWYEWQGEPAWDSGLTDAAGLPRPAWCAFFGSGTCAGSLDAS